MELGLVVLWILAFLMLGFAALPFAAWLLPDTEYVGFAIPIALAVMGIVGHLVGHLAFGWPALGAGLAVLLGLSAVTAERTDADIDFRRGAEYGLVFVAGFLLVVVIRGFDPAAAPLPLSAGEKFLDFGLLNTLDRSGSLPPESMWFAGEPVKYYYGGHLVVSLLATMTGTGTAYAYNLGLAGFFATLVTAAYGLAASIARPYDVSRRLAGALGAFFVGIAGNLETAVRLAAWLLPDSAARALVTTLGMEEGVADWSPGAFWYFDASRVIPVDPQADNGFQAATEFPLFAWLNGDLHAHMLSQPFMLLAAGLLLATWRAPVSHRRLLLFVFLPPLVGLVGFLNLWSLPTVLGLTTLAVFFSPESPIALLPARLQNRATAVVSRGQVHEEVSRLILAPLVAAIALLGGIVWTLPFWTTVIPGSPGQTVAYWDQWTPLGPLVVVLGAFLAAFGAYLARALWTQDDRASPTVVLTAGAFVVTLATLLGRPALGLTLPPILVGWWLLRTESVGFETVLIVAGAGLVLLVEFVTIESERFNVIFKPYVHVWLFWAVGAAVALPRLASGWPALDGVDTTRLRQTGTVLTVALVLLTVPYAGLALHDHVTTGTATTDEVGTTLDATAYLEVHYPGEAPAIRWLDAQSGQPTILTTAPAGYRWNPEDGDGSAAPASLTGIPTVAGWSHEAQYRGEEVYNDRVADVHAMYGGDPDEQRRLLAEYGVEYIYVGPAEQNAPYFEVTVDELDAVTVAESWGSVTVYEGRPGAHRGTRRAGPGPSEWRCSSR
jgi:YYY domain-containing protein